MDAVGSACGASMWIGERTSNSSVSSPVFQMCCAEGEELLAPSRPLPSIIVDLLARNNAIAKEFKQGIRSYNSALSFTSVNVDLDKRYANEKHSAYAFRIHGSVHHLMSPELIPNPNNAIQQPRFAQIYILRPHTMQLLQNMMHDVSLLANIFKTMEELSSEQPNGIEDIRIIFHAERDTERSQPVAVR